LPLLSLVKADQNKEGIAKYYQEIFDCVTAVDNIMDFMEHSKTRRLICEIIEQLSFLNSMHDIIRSDKRLMERLQKYAKVESSVAGILWNIDHDEEIIESGLNDMKKEEEEDTHIMISYTWKYQELAKKISKHLQDRNFKVWLDIEQMSGSTLEAMADAVERSSVVIILFSETYKHSANCRREGEYVAALKKSFIPVLCADGYRADGWLGILLGTKLWFNLSTSQLYEQNIANLEREITTHVNSLTVVPLKRTDTVFSSTEYDMVPLPKRKFVKPPELEKWLRKVGVTDAVIKSARNLGLDGAWCHCYQDVAKSSTIEEFCRISKEFFPDITLVDLFKLRGWLIDI